MGAAYTAVSKDARSHYYPALLLPHNAYHDSNHPDISSFHLPPAGNQEYSDNLLHLMSSPNPTQFDSRQTDTGISKAPLILGLDPARSLGVPLAMTTDIMHLASNISKLLLDLWCGTIVCMPTDDITTWDWAIFRDKQRWEVHGQAVEQSGSFLPSSFDTKPCKIAEKRNSNYKTREFVMYMFGLAPGLLHTLLRDIYWRNLCTFYR